MDEMNHTIMGITVEDQLTGFIEDQTAPIFYESYEGLEDQMTPHDQFYNSLDTTPGRDGGPNTTLDQQSPKTTPSNVSGNSAPGGNDTPPPQAPAGNANATYDAGRPQTATGGQDACKKVVTEGTSYQPPAGSRPASVPNPGTCQTPPPPVAQSCNGQNQMGSYIGRYMGETPSSGWSDYYTAYSDTVKTGNFYGNSTWGDSRGPMWDPIAASTPKPNNRLETTQVDFFLPTPIHSPGGSSGPSNFQGGSDYGNSMDDTYDPAGSFNCTYADQAARARENVVGRQICTLPQPNVNYAKGQGNANATYATGQGNANATYATGQGNANATYAKCQGNANATYAKGQGPCQANQTFDAGKGPCKANANATYAKGQGPCQANGTFEVNRGQANTTFVTSPGCSRPAPGSVGQGSPAGYYYEAQGNASFPSDASYALNQSDPAFESIDLNSTNPGRSWMNDQSFGLPQLYNSRQGNADITFDGLDYQIVNSMMMANWLPDLIDLRSRLGYPPRSQENGPNITFDSIDYQIINEMLLSNWSPGRGQNEILNQSQGNASRGQNQGQGNLIDISGGQNSGQGNRMNFSNWTPGASDIVSNQSQGQSIGSSFGRGQIQSRDQSQAMGSSFGRQVNSNEVSSGDWRQAPYPSWQTEESFVVPGLFDSININQSQRNQSQRVVGNGDMVANVMRIFAQDIETRIGRMKTQMLEQMIPGGIDRGLMASIWALIPPILTQNLHTSMTSVIKTKLKSELTKEMVVNLMERKIGEGTELAPGGIYKLVNDLAIGSFACNKPCQCGSNRNRSQTGAAANTSGQRQGSQNGQGPFPANCIDSCPCKQQAPVCPCMQAAAPAPPPPPPPAPVPSGRFPAECINSCPCKAKPEPPKCPCMSRT